MSQLKKTTTTPLQASLYQLPGAVCYKRKKALKVCIVKSTVATLCPPLRRPFSHKINTLLQQEQIFRKNFLIPSPVAHTAKLGPTLRSSIGTF